jgi:indole-3-glycerol phosphate synthase
MTKRDFLTRIIERRRRRIAEMRAARNIEKMREDAARIRSTRPHHFLRDALRQDSSGVNIIAEIKRASPSKGMIRENLDVSNLALQYRAGGAIAVSVLTEEDYFCGSLEDLILVRQAIDLPILRKDFIVDEAQIYEAAIAGADAVLLITAALDDGALVRLRHLAEDALGLDALVEVHTEDEMRRASESGANLIGVNNRDLQTFNVSLETSVQLAPLAPSHAVLISESGIRHYEDIELLSAHGYQGFLVGESLMRASDAQDALDKLRGGKGVMIA